MKDQNGFTQVPTSIQVTPSATNADGALTEGTIRVVSVDATNVVVRATAASVPFTLYVG